MKEKKLGNLTSTLKWELETNKKKVEWCEAEEQEQKQVSKRTLLFGTERRPNPRNKKTRRSNTLKKEET